MAKKSGKKDKKKTKKEEKEKKLKKAKKEKKQKDKKKKKEKSKKKDKKEKKKKKKIKQKPLSNISNKKEAQVLIEDTSKKLAVKKFNDHSANYNTKQALVVLRSLKNEADVKVFVRGEKRVTITRSINAVLKKLITKH